ncbi:hypothetical protein, partial [Thiolapillus sp.]|uniref:hypothetical protein n=1 Tax=Thiolapillus sp. TaxID=2017437 RepID=UPI0025D8ACB4
GIEVQAGRLSGWWYGPSFENWQHWTAVTDVNGAYELEVPEGFYQLSFFDPTGTYAKKTLANEAIVHRGKTTDSMDEQLNLAGHITGYILGADTTTPPGQVTAYKNSGTDWNWYTILGYQPTQLVNITWIDSKPANIGCILTLARITSENFITMRKTLILQQPLPSQRDKPYPT